MIWGVFIGLLVIGYIAAEIRLWRGGYYTDPERWGDDSG